MQNKKGNVAVISLIIVIVAVTAGVIGFLFAKKTEAPAIENPVVSGGVQQVGGQQKACTQEAKLCSDDNTYVSRTGANCEFAQCPAQIADETADWQTYANAKYGFEFKYPKDWEREDRLTASVLGGDFPHVRFTENELPLLTVYLPHTGNKSIPNREELNRKLSGKSSMIKVSETDALKTVFNEGGQSVPTDEIYIVRNNNAYTMFFTRSMENMDLFENKILSTFKFTN